MSKDNDHSYVDQGHNRSAGGSFERIKRKKPPKPQKEDKVKHRRERPGKWFR